MEIFYIDKVGSTHLWLLEKIKNKKIISPFFVYAGEQTSGIGSRNNKWQSNRGNLFLSFCLEKDFLPKDIPLTSFSIYFSWIMCEVLRNEGSDVWLKWPNDFYIDNLKIGGTITTKHSNILIGSIGINLLSSPSNKGVIDIEISQEKLIRAFWEALKKKPSWKNIFSKYRLEFDLSRFYVSHNEEEEFSLKNALLCDDGSVEINGKKVYSLR